jgi:hypothetical protein
MLIGKAPSSRILKAQLISLTGNAASTPSTNFTGETFQVRVATSGMVVNHSPAGAHLAFAGEHGCFVFLNLKDGIYEARGAVLSSGRGRWAHAAAKEALRRMFEEEGAREIMMAAPKGNWPVRALIRCLKAKYLGRIESAWFWDGQWVPSDIFSLTRTDFEQCNSQKH